MNPEPASTFLLKVSVILLPIPTPAALSANEHALNVGAVASTMVRDLLTNEPETEAKNEKTPEARALLDAVLQTPLPPAATVKLATVLLLKSLMRTSTLEEGVALPEIATVASLVMKSPKSPVSWLIPSILTVADLSCVNVVASL